MAHRVSRRPVNRSDRARILLAAAFTLVMFPVSASAIVRPASVLDGPSNAIIGGGGAAMAPDGSGGSVYRKEVGGVAHVFVVRFIDGQWGTPLEVDGEDSYGSSEPAIAAGEGGRLLVVWVQARNTSPTGVVLYELMSASLEPGASSFGAAFVIDPNVGEPYTGDVNGVDPKVAMAPDGDAYVVYRALVNDCKPDSGDPPDDICPPSGSGAVIEVRAARFEYMLWSSLGTLNRAPQIAMRDPTTENAPSLGIDQSGEGVVAWQEPDSDGVARIWVRRLFGDVQGNVLQASPATVAGRPVTSDAEAAAVAVGIFGEALIAYRIQGAAGSPIATGALFVNSLPSAVDPHGSALSAPIQLTGPATDGLSAPADAIDAKGELRVTWTEGGTARELTGTEKTIGPATDLGSASGQALTAINPAGGGTTAWITSVAGLPAVAVREEYDDGAFQSAILVGGAPGPVGSLSLGGSASGDALLAWNQGPVGQAEVVGAVTEAPPEQFLLDAPTGWVRSAGARISWESSSSAVSGIRYTVYVDGRPRISGLTGLSARLSSHALGDGVHRVQVLASDTAGQQTMSGVDELEIDANPPIVHVRLIRNRRGVRITVRDRASGVDVGATRISFGDGHRTSRRINVTHGYRLAGTYTVVASVRDKVGNHAVVRIRVKVR
jgi:hypothetical protein